MNQSPQDDVTPVWVPDPAVAATSVLASFAQAAGQRYGRRLDTYQAQWEWSVEHLDEFWAGVWSFFEVGPEPAGPVLASREMPGAQWFPHVRLNFVERVFAGRPADAVAVVELTESGGENQLSWRQLEQQVAGVAEQLRALGVGSGDRVVGYLPNGAAAVVGFLATASLGAIWSCCGQDYAAAAAANRLAQLEPAVLICADGYEFAERSHDRRAEAVRLAELLLTVTAVLHVRHLGLAPAQFGVPLIEWDAATAHPASVPLRAEPVPFDHPLWVLYSSGTTGVPKAIVHGHGGVVLDGLKTLALHLDLTSRDRFFWYTTTNWMMWNFAVEALLVGASLVLYDGSPARPHADELWRLTARYGVTVLGTSPGYLLACERTGTRFAVEHDLSALRLLGATGSPVPVSSFHWIREQFDGRLPLVSVSGGTDVVTALAGWAPNLPIWPGEISAPALGVALDAFDSQGKPVHGDVGELVVTAPMPTMPVFFWNDPDGSRYRGSYFDVYDGIWRHGDWITITERGSVVFHGRSDATLNRQGVRLGSADIYEVVEAIPGVLDSLVVGIDLPDGNYWMPLFVVVDGERELDQQLRATITERLRQEASPRHVPDEIIAVRAVPRTRTGKKLEVPVKRILLGADPQRVVSLDAVDDPSALDVFIALARRRR